MITHSPSKSQLTKAAALLKETKRLERENEVLRHCWEDAQKRAETSQKRCLNLISDLSFRDGLILELQREVAELRAHLNPSCEVE